MGRVSDHWVSLSLFLFPLSVGVGVTATLASRRRRREKRERKKPRGFWSLVFPPRPPNSKTTLFFAPLSLSLLCSPFRRPPQSECAECFGRKKSGSTARGPTDRPTNQPRPIDPPIANKCFPPFLFALCTRSRPPKMGGTLLKEKREAWFRPPSLYPAGIPVLGDGGTPRLTHARTRPPCSSFLPFWGQ